jgi:predicted  nucleic acid-binding Zn-ribbon protein
MMTPEILHRCESCGAIIREPAMFCPECGKAIAAKPEQPNENDALVERTEAAANEASTSEVETAGVTAANTDQNPEDSEPVAAPRNPSSTTTEGAKSAGPERHRARERTRETLQRASSAARGAIEDNVKRVEKIHHVSSVMFEEAHYDPSLRFVLVALGLFVIFIILLVLSKVMG